MGKQKKISSVFLFIYLTCVCYYLFGDCMLYKVWECLKVRHKLSVIFMKYGNFYKVYGDDVFIVWKITGYRVINGDHVGFPIKALGNVMKRLEILHVSYIVYDNRDDYLIVDDVRNCYKSVVEEFKKLYLAEDRIKKVVNKFEAMVRNDGKMLDYYEELWK